MWDESNSHLATLVASDKTSPSEGSKLTCRRLGRVKHTCRSLRWLRERRQWVRLCGMVSQKPPCTMVKQLYSFRYLFAAPVSLLLITNFDGARSMGVVAPRPCIESESIVLVPGAYDSWSHEGSGAIKELAANPLTSRAGAGSSKASRLR
ncbi:hypothetical protein CA13_58920 [Planctomycetes bacterium CA13]|uniref:Uncharacterized protein n=1 Tax=Novipirellula herctigrandis TaxID=2527986 RepID=A0A5C5ZAQ0_9BACT|nr:hypothetical protein CA13_58920 [Planctomycetes bacterium CA13]